MTHPFIPTTKKSYINTSRRCISTMHIITTGLLDTNKKAVPYLHNI